jgi:MFS family permease
MLAMFFFLALYLQNVNGYSPLEAGIRFLPSTAVIIVLGPIAGRLTDRIGPRPLMTAGLLLVAAALFWTGHLEVDSGYGSLVGGFVLLGVGMGLVMSPMSAAAMNAVAPQKAGVASGILSMSRMVGGTFGVAAMGALIIGLGRARLGDLLPALPAGQRDRIAESLGAGGATSAGGRVGDAAQEAFVSALNSGMRLGALVALVGAAAAWALIAPGTPDHGAEAAAEGALAAPAAEPARA